MQSLAASAYSQTQIQTLELLSTQVAIAIKTANFTSRPARTGRTPAGRRIAAPSEKRYHGLFEDLPIALWEEDFSALKRHIETLRQSGVTDFGNSLTATRLC